MNTTAPFIPMIAKVNYCAGHAPTVDLAGTRLLHIPGTYRYFHVGAVPRGEEGRKVFEGPMVPGPWAYTFGRASCISSNQAINERNAAEMEAALDVKDGDLLEIDMVVYKVRIVRGEFIELDPA